MTNPLTMDLPQFVDAVKGDMFTVAFLKRGDNSYRVMNARRGVTKHLKGGTLKYDPASKNLLGCYDMKGNPDNPESSAGYKMINLDGLLWLRWAGRHWTWSPRKKCFVEAACT